MNYVKYPRTYHFSFSEGLSTDDKIIEDDCMFQGMSVVITTKMDGENTTVYPDGTCHARSLDSKHQSYHSYLLRRIQDFCYSIPQGYRICGEYLYAKHSIEYSDLPDYFLAFSAWQENNYCLSWSDTKKFCNELDVCIVPELYVGLFDIDIVKQVAKKAVADGQEGIVVRNSESFNIKDFNKNVAKYVRPNHVQTDKHWAQQEIIPNKLKRK